MTAQIPDSLYFKNQQHFVRGQISPLVGIPENSKPKFQIYSSACWRGYIATWLIDDRGWLKVTEINEGKIAYEENEEPLNLLYDFYPQYDSPVTATWVSGDLEVAYGNIVGRCGHYVSVYENYRVFNIEAGHVVNTHEFDSKWWRDKNKCDDRENRLKNYLNSPLD